MSVVLATAGYDKKIRFWEAPSGICQRILKFPDSQVNKLEITPDKQFLAAGGNPHIRLYEIANSEHQQPVLTLEGHTASVTSLGFQRDGRYLYSSSEDGTIKLWDLRNPTYSRSFDVKAPVRSVALRSDRDEIISGDAAGNITVWDLGDNGFIHQIQPGRGSTGGCLIQTSIQAVDISDDCRTFAAVSNHGTVYVWDPISQNTGNFLENPPITKFRAHPTGSYCLHAKISPDCRHLCTTGSDGSARLFDTTTWELKNELKAHKKWVWDAAFCADSSYLVTASSDTTARLWNLRSGELTKIYHGHQSAVTCVALNDSSV
ncbi:WD repeat-containing protein wat1 [Fragilariopsis cylindrus CCMP1102]|uniref:WD repeat-containing protein wat1 n=1 Tax=Fragilariopsis cylindrus CCMP1102 TaxID=635003 RepID=A0A1E7FDX2_9STRA|nr:WD repeat-containing protein wat1 [Fragilariopsis cylindrus CCMP1102]|eukprot:OEU16380.1 WD repeat-containing protein wat1 [Fragilariopsis cylindrus CCMP1102]